MSRNARTILVVALACALLMAVSLYFKSWGGVALVLVAAAGFAWYRIQVARGEQATERFFADAGEETRLTSFQATGFPNASPGEMPADQPRPPPPAPAPPADPR
jgi:hypothetical protein